MRSLILTLVVALTLPTLRLAAQQDSLPLNPGDRVRVTSSALRHGVGTGIVDRFEFETIFFTHQNLAVPVATVTKVEVSRERGAKTGRVLGYPILGMLGVGFAGALIMYAQCAPCNFDMEPLAPGLGLIFGGMIGFFGGLIIGLIPTERWEEIPLERLKFGETSSGYTGVSMSLSFGVRLYP
ncbi:MAG: hypothetical protein OEZ54_09740 [Gemmatimonadota bacterium]|nr:hypothetical protein [Gemmatimonadota bacterium]